MKKKTSFVLGLLSSFLTLTLILIWLGLLLILFFPLSFLLGVDDVIVFVTATIIRIMLIAGLVFTGIPIIIYGIATPHYFLYLHENHSRFVLNMHKIVNIILCGLLFMSLLNLLKGILFEGRTIHFEFWFVLTALCLILPLAVFTKVPKKQKQDL